MVGGWDRCRQRDVRHTLESDWLARLRLPTVCRNRSVCCGGGHTRSCELSAVRREGRKADIRELVSDIRPESGHDFDGREAAIGMKLVQMGDLSAKPQDVVSALAERLGPVELVWLERRSLQTENRGILDGTRPAGRTSNGGKEVIQDV